MVFLWFPMVNISNISNGSRKGGSLGCSAALQRAESSDQFYKASSNQLIDPLQCIPSQTHTKSSLRNSQKHNNKQVQHLYEYEVYQVYPVEPLKMPLSHLIILVGW